MTFKRAVVGAVVLGAAAFSGSALAGVTGNVGVVSEYMFRGVTQTFNGAAVSGGLDYAADSGIYVGTWASNINWGVGGSELDVYGGFTKKFNDIVGIDVGAIYYYYPEADEEAEAVYGEGFDPNTIEVYAGMILGPATVKYFYSPNYFGNDTFNPDGDDVSSSYLVASAAFPLSDTLSLTAGVGYLVLSEETLCDAADLLCPAGVEATDKIIDYNVGLAKTVGEGMTFNFSIAGTDLENDDPGIVVGLKKTFDL